jgi:hypothetical protein
MGLLDTALLGRVGTAELAALGAAVAPGCEPQVYSTGSQPDRPPSTKGIQPDRPDEVHPTDGIRPDRPKTGEPVTRGIRPDRPQPQGIRPDRPQPITGIQPGRPADETKKD